MAFRDENEALRAKVQALEEEVETLQEQLAERDEPAPKARVPVEPAPPGESPDAGSIRAMVAAREAAERRARSEERSAEERARLQRIRRYGERPRRVRVERRDGATLKVVVSPKILRDKLREQLPWGFGFAFFNPGVFVVIALVAILIGVWDFGFGAAVGLALPLWAASLSLLNLGWALATRKGYTLETTADGDFVVYRSSPRRPTLLGRRAQLKADVDDPDPARLGRAVLGDGRTTVEVDRLTSKDLSALRSALGLGEK